MMKLIASLLFGSALLAQSATYYVDFDGGNNASAGTSTGAAWKHFPDDPNATGTANSATLSAGDTVNFKGGVRYQGSFILSFSGATNNPIILDGNNGWGTGKAIIDGTELFGNAWTQCTSAGQVAGNTNYANIWFASALTGQGLWQQVIVSNNFLAMSQDRNQEAPYLFDIATNWNTVASSAVTVTTLQDTSLFTQTDADWYQGAYIGFHISGNGAKYKAISSFNTSTDTITFDTLSGGDIINPQPYTILGAIGHIDTPGEFAVVTNKMFLWPPGNTDPNTLEIRVSSLSVSNGIITGSRNFVTVRGFEVNGIYGGDHAGLPGCAIGSTGSGPLFGLSIISNDCRNIRSYRQIGAINCNLGDNAGGSLGVVFGNTISNCLRSRGMQIHGQNLNVISNRVVDVGGTGIYFAQVKPGLMSANFVSGIRGVHGNGLSVYQYSEDVVIEKNTVSACSSPITYEQGSNHVFRNNFVDCKYGQIDQWGNMYGPVYWLNNTIVNSDRGSDATKHFSLNVRPAIFGASATLIGNIMDGASWPDSYPANGSNITRAFNVWLGRNSGYAQPTMINGEVFDTNYVMFVSHVGEDYRPLLSGTAYGMVTNLSSYGYTDDVAGYTRSRWNVGAYEYQAGGGSSTYQGFSFGPGVKLIGPGRVTQ
jgi:hypothetical protein